ncbi:helix-turn-helix domain-containing protein [Micromonosporaceae bacterium Da 78-11]
MTPTSDDDRGPTVIRMRLGAQLRQLRIARRVTRAAAGWEIRASASKISRMELGQVPVKERDLADLLTLYGVHGDERAMLLTLARQANAPGWWQRLGDVVPPWHTAYLVLEQAASLIRTYDLHFVPALLQTPDYARTLLALAHADGPQAQLARRVALREGRQRVLRGADPPLFWSVIDEAVLRRGVGDGQVLRGQLEALIEAARLPNIRLQIASLGADVLAAAGFPFAILRFAEAELPDLVYVEQSTSALYLDKPPDVEHYVVVMERACAGAAAPDDTEGILRSILRDTYR